MMPYYGVLAHFLCRFHCAAGHPSACGTLGCHSGGQMLNSGNGETHAEILSVNASQHYMFCRHFGSLQMSSVNDFKTYFEMYEIYW